MASVLDSISKTAEGISNTTTLFDSSKKLLKKRSRFIRTFYSSKQFYKNYNE